MEPVTHMLMGAVLARAGVNRRAAYATVAMTIAAELPDVDIAWWVRGPVTELLHHRGITHALVGLPVEAALVVATCWGWERWRGSSKLRSGAKLRAPLSWGWLYGGSLLALLSHLLLDWTNNYGVRPFFPFNPRWYEGSFVFIFEPVLFALLLGALLLPWLFGLINAEVGARKARFAGRGWAWAALVGVAGLYMLRYTEHARAIELARQSAPEGTTRIFASPVPTNPFVWHVVMDTPGYYARAEVDTHRELMEAGSPSDLLYKPQTTLALLAAKRSYLGEVYLDWSSWPVLSEGDATEDAAHPLTAVTFTDARFLYETWLTGALSPGRAKPVLGATVMLEMAAPAAQRVVEMTMSGRIQR